MIQVILSRSAADYLRHETDYLKSRNPSAAAKFTALIREVRANLQRFPDMGSEAHQLPIPGARTWVAGDYLLDYRHDGERIEIVTIRHGRMKPLTPGMEMDDDFDSDPDDAPVDTRTTS